MVRHALLLLVLFRSKLVSGCLAKEHGLHLKVPYETWRVTLGANMCKFGKHKTPADLVNESIDNLVYDA